MDEHVPLGPKGVVGNSTGRVPRAPSAPGALNRSRTAPKALNRMTTSTHPASLSREIIDISRTNMVTQALQDPSSPVAAIPQLPNLRSLTATPRSRMANTSPRPASRKRRAQPAPGPSPKKLVENQFIHDRLGTLVSSMSEKYKNSPTWKAFADQIHGRSYLSERIDDIDHPAKPVLQAYRDLGVPVHVTGEDW